MKTKLGMPLLITFIVISIIIVYKEASARPMLCDTMEQMCCDFCGGEIHYIWGHDFGGGLIYCEFECNFPLPPGFPCEWETSPVYGLCVL